MVHNKRTYEKFSACLNLFSFLINFSLLRLRIWICMYFLLILEIICDLSTESSKLAFFSNITSSTRISNFIYWNTPCKVLHIPTRGIITNQKCFISHNGLPVLHFYCCTTNLRIQQSFENYSKHFSLTEHGSALEGSDPPEWAPGFEVCQMKGTHIGAT